MAKGQKPAAQFDETKREAYIEAIKGGLSKTHAANSVGISDRTVRNHLRDDSAFAEAVSRAEMDRDRLFVDEAEQSILAQVRKGNMTAIQVVLYNLSGGKWTDRRAVPPVLTPEQAMEKIAQAAGISLAELRQAAEDEAERQTTKDAKTKRPN